MNEAAICILIRFDCFECSSVNELQKLPKISDKIICGVCSCINVITNIDNCLEEEV